LEKCQLSLPRDSSFILSSLCVDSTRIHHNYVQIKFEDIESVLRLQTLLLNGFQTAAPPSPAAKWKTNAACPVLICYNLLSAASEWRPQPLRRPRGSPGGEKRLSSVGGRCSGKAGEPWWSADNWAWASLAVLSRYESSQPRNENQHSWWDFCEKTAPFKLVWTEVYFWKYTHFQTAYTFKLIFSWPAVCLSFSSS